MGDIADWMIDQAIFGVSMGLDYGEECEDDIVVEDFQWWVTQAGNRIHIKKMETSHLKNCLRMMDRMPGFRPHWREHLEKELKTRS